MSGIIHWVGGITVTLLASIAAKFLATFFLGPAMTIFCGFEVVRWLAKVRRKFHRDDFFDGPWRQVAC